MAQSSTIFMDEHGGTVRLRRGAACWHRWMDGHVQSPRSGSSLHARHFFLAGSFRLHLHRHWRFLHRGSFLSGQPRARLMGALRSNGTSSGSGRGQNARGPLREEDEKGPRCQLSKSITAARGGLGKRRLRTTSPRGRSPAKTFANYPYIGSRSKYLHMTPSTFTYYPLIRIVIKIRDPNICN
jgi:hypothetical protein